MTAVELVALSPLLALAATVVATMVVVALARSHGAAMVTTLIGFAAAIVVLPRALAVAPLGVTDLLVIDRFALLHLGVLVAAAAAVAALARGYLQALDEQREEFYLLLSVATLGAAVLAAAGHFASLLLGLEILSIGLYGMISYDRGRAESLEAGMKYLLPAVAASAVLLFGVALIYAETGTLSFAELGQRLDAGEVRPLWLLTGAALFMVGVGFKLALVPFHLWAPDVYQGAPAPAAAFLSTLSKAAVVVVTVRLFAAVPVLEGGGLVVALAVIAVVTIFWGNLLALKQRSLKRLLGCSSIAHMGYLLVGLLAADDEAMVAVSVYLITYVVTSLAAFGVVTALSPTGEGDLDRIDDLRGLGRRRPWMAALLTLSLLSLTGLPLTPGFIGKYSVITAGLRGGHWIPVVSVVLGTVISLAYYMGVVRALYSFDESDEVAPASQPDRFQIATWLALTLAGAAVLWLGVLPSTMIELIRPAVEALM